MKRILTKLMFVFAVLSLVVPMNMANVFATDSSQDGLVVKTKTDKDSYKEGEKATVFIAVHNTNGYDMKNINIEVSLPEGISLAQQQDLNIPILKADEIKEYKIVVEKEGKQITVSSDDTNENNTQNNITVSSDPDDQTTLNDHDKSSKVETSDQNTIGIFVILLGVSLTIIFVIKKDKKCKKMLIIALVSTMTLSTFNLGVVKAESTNEELRSFETKQNIKFNDTTYSLNLKTLYVVENGQIVDRGEITREEWIVKLIDLMGYEATFEAYSFDDFEESKNPDKIETAIQYGLVDLKADKNNKILFEPNKYATREFVAYSTIKALGFYTYNTSVECNDHDILVYPDIDKLMVHYGMFKLVNNDFKPNQYVSNNEIDIIIAKIKEFNSSLEINSSAKNEIEYNENVKQYTLDFDLNEDKKIITSNDNQLSNIKNGEIVILNNPNNIAESIAIQVDKIENTNNEYTIHYTEPSIDQVVNDIQVEGVVGNQNAIFIPEDDVVIESLSRTKSRSKLTEIPFNESVTAGFEIKGKNKISSLSGKVSLDFKEMKYKFDLQKLWGIPVGVKEAQFEFLLESKASIEIESKNEDDKTSIWKDKEDINKKLGQVIVPTPYGVYGSVELYLITSISGTVKLSIQADANVGFQYKSGNIRNIGYLNTETGDLNINAETKLGIKPSASLELVGFDLVKADTEAGVAANAGISNIKPDPLEYCVDANLYVYWTMGVQFGPDIMNIRFDADLYNEKKSPFKRNMHFEENGYVPECTRDRNNIKGLVKNAKSPHNPIVNARVQIYNEANNIMSELNTNETGAFTSQKLKSGTYTIIVLATGYETYRETVEVSSGKEIFVDIFLTKSNEDSGDIDDEELNKTRLKLEVGKSYRIECISDTMRFLTEKALTDTTTEFYYSNDGMSGAVLNDELSEEGVSLRTMEKGDFIEIKLISGEMIIYDYDDKDFYKFFKVIELEHDPLKKIELSPGSVVSLDNQYIGNKATYITYGFFGNNLSGTRKVVDYYWNNRFGWDIRTTNYDLETNDSFWTSVDEGCIHEYTINSGNAMIYLWYEDAQKLVINE